MDKPKPYEIPKKLILDAFRRVKANHGAAGIDSQSIEMLEADLKNNLYKLWNRMSSGSYFPPPVKAVEIPKKAGGSRTLGVPTVSDRVAQMVVKMTLEPMVEPIFHPDSYGYRPGRSAHQALEITRKRCWQYDWVLEFDIKGLFDNIDHDLLMRAVRRHTDNPWVVLYIGRWLKAPFQMPDGTIEARQRGTPQGGVISPVLANLFLHYAFDAWMSRMHPDKPFARYADDAVAHCRTEAEAVRLKADLEQRLAKCGLDLNQAKTRIVYCQDSNRSKTYPSTSFDFLGYTFRPRLAVTQATRAYFVSFSPAVSPKAQVAMQRQAHEWQLHLRTGLALADLARMINPVVRGWIQYYGRYYRSVLAQVLRHLDRALVLWVRRKYKKLQDQRRATHWLGRVARRQPTLFAHWEWGVRPAAE